jgi:hypothetical protein
MGETLVLSGGVPVSHTPDPQKTLLENFRDEIFEYYRVMKEFNDMEASEVFRALSAFSARASEVRAVLMQMASKRGDALRLRLIDPFLDECDRQFKVHSRLVAIQEADMRLAGGKYT